MRIGCSGTHSPAVRTSGSTPLEEGMTQLAGSQAVEKLHHREPQQDAAASVDQPG